MSDKTNEQVERAAKAYWEASNREIGLPIGHWGEGERKQYMWAARVVLTAAGVAPQEVNGSTSDGYHTFDELYEYRMLYNAHAAQGWLAAGLLVVKSWSHSDGEKCFGGGWFIVTAMLPSGQVSNHYRAEHWGLFDVPEVAMPPEYDGHSPAEVAERLRGSLTGVAPQAPSVGLRIDDDGLHIYWHDPVEGCWVAFKRVDCVSEEELPSRSLAAPPVFDVDKIAEVIREASVRSRVMCNPPEEAAVAHQAAHAVVAHLRGESSE